MSNQVNDQVFEYIGDQDLTPAQQLKLDEILALGDLEDAYYYVQYCVKLNGRKMMHQMAELNNG